MGSERVQPTQPIRYKMGMFDDPLPAPLVASVFKWVWTYNVNTDEAHTKKPVESVTVPLVVVKYVLLDHTYASCMEQTSAFSSLLAYLRRRR